MTNKQKKGNLKLHLFKRLNPFLYLWPMCYFIEGLLSWRYLVIHLHCHTHLDQSRLIAVKSDNKLIVIPFLPNFFFPSTIVRFSFKANKLNWCTKFQMNLTFAARKSSKKRLTYLAVCNSLTPWMELLFSNWHFYLPCFPLAPNTGRLISQTNLHPWFGFVNCHAVNIMANSK